MFKNKFQGGIISVFSSTGSAPLLLWGIQVKNGHIKRVSDPEIITYALEIMGVNQATTYITIPRNIKQDLAIRLPFVVMVAKNLNKYFSFEITILDDANIKRRFMCSNFQTKTKIKTFFTVMPICLIEGWNKIQFNLADLTRRAYGTLYIMTCRIEVHANVRLRRIYFSDRLYEDEELPREYRVEPNKRKPQPGQKGEGDGAVPPAPAPGVTPPPSTPPEKKGSEAAVPAEEGAPAPPDEAAPPAEAAPAAEEAPPPEEPEQAEGGEAPAEEAPPAEEGGGEEAPPAEEAPAEEAAAEEAPPAEEGGE